MRITAVALAALFLVSVPSHAAGVSAVKDRLVVLDDQTTESTFIGVTSPEEVARQFLKQYATKLGLNSELADLQYEATVRTAVGYVVRFQHVQSNMAVYASDVTVSLNRNLQVITYINGYKAFNTTEGLAAPKIRNTEAVKGVYSYLKLNSSPTRQQVLPMILVKNGRAQTIYRVRINAPADRKYSWEILVDAETNKILYAKDIAMNDKIEAQVFDPNPTVRSGKAYGQATGYNDNNNGDTDFFNSMMTKVELPDVEKVGGKYNLKGKYVEITDHEAPTNPDCRTTSAVMNYTRSKPCFDAVTVYYFIDKSLRYVNEKLGIQAMPYQYSGGLKADPHGLGGEDNSHYDPSAGTIAFGEGGVDDAQDHDVILHELGHGIHDWVTHGHLSQVQGLSEGSGDYWAVSYARQFMNKSNVAWNWSFSYDGHNEFWPGRVTNVSGNYPSAAGGQIHSAGQLWATACLLVWDAIGKEKTDKIFWSGLAMLTSSSNQNDAANALVKAAGQLYPADKATVANVFKSKGYTISN